MLWHKGWLETRFRLLFALFMVTLLQTISIRGMASQQGVTADVLYSIPVLVVMVCSVLAGAGVTTQPSLGVTRGIHGSTLFTLSLPVSRWKLLSVRATVGWLEAAAVLGALCGAFWSLSSAVRTMATPGLMFGYLATLMGCSLVVYFFSVLLGTMLDDQWRTWGTMLVCTGLWWLSAHGYLPTFMDIFRGMGKGSPLLTHTIPWGTIGFSMLAAAALFFASAKILEAREY
jgi:hypothetical protein